MDRRSFIKSMVALGGAALVSVVVPIKWGARKIRAYRRLKTFQLNDVYKESKWIG